MEHAEEFVTKLRGYFVRMSCGAWVSLLENGKEEELSADDEWADMVGYLWAALTLLGVPIKLFADIADQAWAAEKTPQEKVYIILDELSESGWLTRGKKEQGPPDCKNSDRLFRIDIDSDLCYAGTVLKENGGEFIQRLRDYFRRMNCGYTVDLYPGPGDVSQLTQMQLLEAMLRGKGVPLHDGMSQEQIEQAEQRYDIKFPPDYAEMLRCFVPVGEGFYAWDDDSQESKHAIIRALDWPMASILFDVENNNFWRPDWGERPAQPEDLDIAEINIAYNVANGYLLSAPPLIPIYGHRYLPSEPHEAGNPVLSVFQTDIIYYGSNLIEYFFVEFKMKEWKDIRFDEIKQGIPFWGWFLED